jgi:hypothetical protein
LFGGGGGGDFVVCVAASLCWWLGDMTWLVFVCVKRLQALLKRMWAQTKPVVVWWSCGVLLAASLVSFSLPLCVEGWWSGVLLVVVFAL